MSDEAAAQSVLDRVFNASAVGRPTKETVGGVELTVITGEDREKLAFGITNGYALVGALDAVKATVDRKENPLTDLGIYQRDGGPDARDLRVLQPDGADAPDRGRRAAGAR